MNQTCQIKPALYCLALETHFPFLKVIEGPQKLLFMWVICINIYYTKIKTEKSKNIYLKNNYVLP